jgi:hypothetical protein
VVALVGQTGLAYALAALPPDVEGGCGDESEARDAAADVDAYLGALGERVELLAGGLLSFLGGLVDSVEGG